MVEFQPRSNCIHHLSITTVNDLETPDVIGIARPVLSIASYLVVSFGHWCWLVVAVDVPSRHLVLKPHQVPILDQINHSIFICVVWWLLVPLLDHKPVVLVLVRIGGHLLLFGAHALWVEMEVRVKICPSCPVVLQANHCSIRHFSGHGGVVQAIALQSCLEEGGKESIAGAGLAEDGQVAVEVGHVEEHWKDYKAKGTSCEVLQEMQKVFGGVPENLPELTDGEDANIENNKKADKLDGNSARQKRTCRSQP